MSARLHRGWHGRPVGVVLEGADAAAAVAAGAAVELEPGWWDDGEPVETITTAPRAHDDHGGDHDRHERHDHDNDD